MKTKAYDMRELESALKSAAYNGYVRCKCGNKMEPDLPRCYCGRENPLAEVI